jgi:glycosyltransferase involved in cell wall biosynthesis
MGRFHDQKGIFETIDIVKKVKLLKPDVTLGILGGGSKNIESKFLQMIKKDNLEENIFCLGYIVGNRKYSVLSESKIFLFPSYYESFPLAPLEAMKCGLPVVAYNLPPLQVFKKGMVKVPILNNKEMANKIWLLLDNNKYYEKIRKDALNFSSNFAWEKTGAEIYKLIQELNNKKTI